MELLYDNYILVKSETCYKVWDYNSLAKKFISKYYSNIYNQKI